MGFKLIVNVSQNILAFGSEPTFNTNFYFEKDHQRMIIS
jgi:hypothetical protein